MIGSRVLGSTDYRSAAFSEYVQKVLQAHFKTTKATLKLPHMVSDLQAPILSLPKPSTAENMHDGRGHYKLPCTHNYADK